MDTFTGAHTGQRKKEGYTLDLHGAKKRYNDQYHCADCGKQWDVDDPDPPECRRESRAGQDAIDAMRKLFSKNTLQSDK